MITFYIISCQKYHSVSKEQWYKICSLSKRKCVILKYKKVFFLNAFVLSGSLLVIVLKWRKLQRWCFQSVLWNHITFKNAKEIQMLLLSPLDSFIWSHKSCYCEAPAVRLFTVVRKFADKGTDADRLADGDKLWQLTDLQMLPLWACVWLTSCFT